MRTGIGDTLRAARRAQGRTLRDAAQATRVRETYLAALEEEEFDGLGGEVYARGFLRSYARFLELDPEPLLEAFAERESDRGPARVGRSRGDRPARDHAAGEELPGTSERPAGAAVLLLLVLLVLVVVALLGLWDGRAGAVAAGLAVSWEWS